MSRLNIQPERVDDLLLFLSLRAKFDLARLLNRSFHTHGNCYSLSFDRLTTI